MTAVVVGEDNTARGEVIMPQLKYDTLREAEVTKVGWSVAACSV